MKIGNVFKKLIIEDFNKPIDEDYPLSFSFDEFKKLTSFRSRMDYCRTHLKTLGAGSSRIVYLVDDEKVLKLAKNAKGLAQNEVEISYSDDNYTADIMGKIYDYDENNLWLEMQLAKPLTARLFKEIVGFDFKLYSDAIAKFTIGNNPQKYRGYQAPRVSDEVMDAMWENEFISLMFNYIGTYDTPYGDLVRLSTYGVVEENGVKSVVMIDYGLNDDVHVNYYSK